MKRLKLLFHTVRYLRVRQLGYQVYYRIRKPRLRKLPAPVLRGELDAWPGEAYLEPATRDGRTFTFLGQTARFDGNWNDPAVPKLWLYNLHYQDHLNARGAESRIDLCEHMVDAWVEGNPPLAGNGWEPYCLSLRIVNWVKFFSRLGSGRVKETWLQSLAQQTDALEQQLEFHILANHLFANAKALVFAGTYLGGTQGDRWLRKGLALLDREVPEQFLEDGAHYERSPMYHGTLLWDLADLIALFQATRFEELEKRVNDWRQRVEKGLEWLAAMTHPDGEISFFNDAAFGIAPNLTDLTNFAGSLGLAVPSGECPERVQVFLLQESGFGVIDWPERHRLLVDVAPVGPGYQPGHAHADTLSCELSLFGQRVLVNSGISQYGQDVERHKQRSTAAHNTVEVDGQNSSEVWGGFRVARRAMPFDVGASQGELEVRVWGKHDGYRRLPGGVIHHREWRASSGRIVIEDVLSGSYGSAVAYWHLHPHINIEPIQDFRLLLTMPGGQKVSFIIEGAKSLRSIDSQWHPQFGLSIKNTKIALELSGKKLVTRLEF